ncbi:metallophosphoesterase [Nitrosococcus wardiae]|uniref:metallophosphoesterase n=1 Tax=Nitrosococcus wardiae TaxID=1814290 RepID=UPI0019825417|nr:metallophosphoesterase [Nitrosococcus wardiae]
MKHRNYKYAPPAWAGVVANGVSSAEEILPLEQEEILVLKQLERRVGPLHLRQRLGIEGDHETHVFSQGRNFFHIENWYSVHSFIRMTLRCLALHRRGKRNALAIQVRHNEISLKGLPPSFEGYTLLHLSDLHLDMNGQLPHALIEQVQKVEYDLCVITGDLRAKTYGPYQAVIEAVEQLRPHLKAPIYGVLGNHDTIRMVPGLEAMGVRVLLNEAVAIERDGAALYLAGVDDPHYYCADNLEKACAEIPESASRILLAHSPEIYKRAAHCGFDVMFCGHTHGGQICLPGGIPLMVNARCPRRICAGPWRYHQMQGYTSVGSGVCVVDVRLNCPPEITLHRLRCD